MQNNYRSIIFVLLGVLAAVGCDALYADDAALSARINALIAEVEEDVGDVPVQHVEAVRNADRSTLILVDARSRAERDVSLIAGAISLAEFEKAPANPKAQVIVYCTIGLRSGRVVRALRTRGFDAFNLRGGVLAWLAAGGTVVDTQGNPTQRIHVYGRRWNAVPTTFEPVW